MSDDERSGENNDEALNPDEPEDEAPEASEPTAAGSSLGPSSGSSGKKKRHKETDVDRSDDNEEDEDDDEEDEEDEEEEDSAPKSSSKKRRRKGAPSIHDPKYFLDLEAEVDEDEGDEDEGAEDEGDLIQPDDRLPDDEREQLREAEQRRQHRRAMMHGLMANEELDEEALRQRYAGYAEPVHDDLEDLEAFENRRDIVQKSLLPTVKDPKLWMVKCKFGQEMLTAISLMQKCMDRELEIQQQLDQLRANQQDESALTLQPLLIRSAIAAPHLKGAVYVEAEKEAHVADAIKGIRNLLSFHLFLVPLKEMPDVLRVPSRADTQLRKNSWVRMKRGIYRGDVAQIVDADDARAKYTVRLVPRIDLAYQQKYAAYRRSVADGDESAKRPTKPKIIPQRFFNPEEARQLGLAHLLEERRDVSGDKFVFFGDARFKDGYMYKTCALNALEISNVMPSLEELQRFQSGSSAKASEAGDEEDDAVQLETFAAQRLKAAQSRFAKGDVVRVINGELRHLVGSVEAVEDDKGVATVLMRPQHPDLKNKLLKLPASSLQKHFTEGQHVKVIGGRFEDEVGMIVHVDGNVAVIYSDLTQKELKVFIHDMQACSEITTGRLELGSYELYDLVQLDAHTVGVICRIEKDAFRVLDQTGNVRTVRLQEMGPKRNTRNPQSFDSMNNPLGLNDQVVVRDGKHKGKQAVVKHLHRAFVFLHSKDVPENRGLYVERTSNVTVLGGTQRSAIRTPTAVMASPGTLLSTGRGNEGARGTGLVGRGGFGGGRGRGFVKDPLLHKTVVIRGPTPWKGYVGIVKDVAGENARVELHTACKTITVPKRFLHEETRDAAARGRSSGAAVSGVSGVSAPGGAWGQMPGTVMNAPRTPSLHDITRTPMRDEVGTPMFGSETPAWNPSHLHTPRPQSPPADAGGSGWNASVDHTDQSAARGPAAAVATAGFGTPYGFPQLETLGGTPAHTPGGVLTPQQLLAQQQQLLQPSVAASSFATPLGTPRTPFTPHDFTAPTPPPVGGYNPQTPNPQTPHPQTPHPQTPHPQTPHPSTPHSAAAFAVPATPAEQAANALLNSLSGALGREWVCADIEVAAGQRRAVVRQLRGANECGVRFLPVTLSGDLTWLSRDQLELVTPGKKDRVKVVRGDLRGHIGSLVGIDGNDGIVKMDSQASQGDIKILRLDELAKYVPPETA